MNSKNDLPTSSSEKENEEMDDSTNQMSDEDEDMSDDESSEEEAETVENENSRVYLPPKDGADNDVPLECDESAYIFYHVLKAGSPCLSFDLIPDSLENDRTDEFPITLSVVAGTQAEKARENKLMVMKMINITKDKTKAESNDDEDEESESDDEDSVKPTLQCATTQHSGCVNRVKMTRLGEKPIVASWSELGKVFIWNISHPLKAINDYRVMVGYIQNNEGPRPIFSFSHQVEGYAMDWSPLTPGVLATGDCRKYIHLWKPLEDGSWHVEQKPYTAHTKSVEDIQWSPNESNVLASCSVDRSVRIWDIRAAPNKACMLSKENAHDRDVNVISWNKYEPFILSGGDDGALKVWDLRKFPDGPPVCVFKHHTAPITSVEWHPTDSSVFAASGADDQLTLWDLAVERDSEQEQGEEANPELEALPAQLLFIHQGQKEIKELHWYKQMPGVLLSTAESGFNVFRALSV